MGRRVFEYWSRRNELHMSSELPIPDKALNVLVTKTLTLPDVTSEEEAMIQEAAGPDSTVVIVDSPKEGIEFASTADVILGICLLYTSPSPRDRG